jgi:hypothetical protein
MDAADERPRRPTSALRAVRVERAGLHRAREEHQDLPGRVRRLVRWHHALFVGFPQVSGHREASIEGRRRRVHGLDPAFCRLIVIGDVSSAKLAKTRFSKAVYDAAWGISRAHVHYKAIRLGRAVSQAARGSPA